MWCRRRTARSIGGVTPPMLAGETVSDAWRSARREPDRYLETTPAGFLKPILAEPDSRSLSNYLAQRYWSGM